MSINKENAIQDILSRFEDMANTILRQLDLIEEVMSQGETEVPANIAKEIASNEKKIDKLDVKIGEKIVNTIVLQKPVASDLRQMMAIYQMVGDLERIGDLVTNIAGSIPRIKDEAVFERLSDVISNMLISSVNMVRKSILSFINNDKEYAIWTIKNDSVIDELNHKLIKKTVKKSKLPKETQDMLLSFININSIISNIERIADHATNVAEASIYSLEGTDIRHKQIDLDGDEL
ncbi:phosphate signaling complex protein PhoU [Prolixibacter denitrificans]|uniref:Phosphate transport system protein n=1 Tax=Prolixibacter denitrificans TaxID=1541063 RepID=A0A2P8CGA3_9BACT|nr:phosphate signaling complex protein PhoU [Prolixibacter denitrificans]PSK84015.1 phosphate transport system protein [Prolixibacter denitrificans]GET23557.1 phosphate transport system regulatory protein PhoU [Prolixibacter denitrificans]